MNRKTGSKEYWLQKTYLFQFDEYICSVCGYSADRAYKKSPSCDSDMSKSKYDPSWVDEAEMMDIVFGE